MLQIHDVRETRVYKDALVEGRVEGMEQTAAIAWLVADKKTAAEIADTLHLEVEFVRRVIAMLPPISK